MNILQQTQEILRGLVENQFGGNFSAASVYFGLDPKTGILRKWIRGERAPSLTALSPVFEKLGISLREPHQQITHYDFVPKIAARAGAGASLETSDEVEGFYAFRKDFMGMQHISSAHSVMLDVSGDSMGPLFRDGDTILVDKSDTEIRDGRIYLVTLGDELRVKHVQKTLHGLLLRSENPRYADVPVEGPDLETFIVHGRVRWCGKVL